MLLATWLGLFFIKGCLAVFVEVTPKEVLALPYQNVTFLCKVAVPIQYCRMEVPGMTPLNLKPNSPPYQGVGYHGSGLQAGQCGITIDNVKDVNNGIIKCTLGVTTEPQESSAIMHLVVAKPPRSPELEILQNSDYWAYKVGDVIHATCTVRDGRPVANLSWYLDDELLPNSVLSPPMIISGTQEELQTVYQNLTKKLQSTDNGRSLKCVSNHPAITSNNFAYRQLNVTYPPIPQSNPIDKFGYILGKDGIISLIVEANPKPHLEWIIRDQVIKAGGHDSTGRIKAEELRDLGRGLYEAVLIIADIQKHDTETQYILKVYNDMGNYDYVILISTSAEPEDLELGVLSIIGIVIAVLILLLIVFLVIFARVTGRWCFSGAGVRNRHMGESSDTESVEVRPKNLLVLPNLNFASLFKKKDKPLEDEERPKSAETVETKIPLDETDKTQDGKEGIVYAELDLVNPNLKPLVKNYDDKTEYAEIVYAQKDNDEAEKNDNKA
ncbi:hypothetical protein RN001_011279 [Aquatica leii]|uniref:Ig-like domain-containing protein n=1 Tax=Aquatica leii TaxID=1421715 RepID=A0AAN7SNN8_9COLE|nr:hypothetical protein RN001_011279 [Aquatica leii]